MRRRNAIPRTEREREARERALAALALMRRKKLSLTAATNAEGTTPRTVRRYVGSALRQKGPGERSRPTPHDRIPRTLNVVGRTLPIKVRDSRTVSRIAEHMNAVKTYVKTGDPSALARFRGKSYQAAGVTYPFITDPAKLDQLADAGVLEIEGLYRAVGGMTV